MPVPNISLNAARLGRLAARSVRGLARAALDLALPPVCITCDALVTRQGQFCAACFRAMGFITEPFCRRCAAPFASRAQAGPACLCPACLERPPAWARARAAFRYDDQARRLVLPFKHADRVELARVLGDAMLRVGGDLLAGADLLVPVPLHRRRLFTRRYNQAALLARYLARKAHVPCVPDLLVRPRPTPALGHSGAAARAALLADAFALRPRHAARLAGRSVLLIDDVLTSGATANACARTLLAGGAAAVDVLVAARVPDPRLQ